MDFLDLFAGTGFIRRGMEMAGHKCVGYVENDKFARKSYEAIHDTEGEWTAYDIRTVDPTKMPDFGCLCFGFPCQDNTILTKSTGPDRQGTKEGTRSGLYFEALRVARVKKPKYLFAENVTGLFSVNGGHDFAEVLKSMGELGYIPEWQVCNSRRLLPQNRPRVFIVGHFGGAGFKPVFPLPELSEIPRYRQNAEEEQAFVHCLLARKGGPSLEETYICEPGGGPRRTSIRELFKLQGAPGEWADKARKAGVPTGELRKIAGNGASIPIICEIARRLE